MRAWMAVLATPLVVWCLAACAIDFPTIRQAEQICTPGENVFCRCPGGDPGTRNCHPDGTTFGECVVASGVACGEAGDDTQPPVSPPSTPPTDTPGTKEDPPSHEGGGVPGGQGGAGGAGGGGPVGNCGTVDYFGECAEDQLSWCNQGQLVETDCTATQKVCGFVSDAVGYDCVDPPDPCEGLTVDGECQGDTLRYCISEQITETDCAAQSQVCGYSDTLGFYDCIDPPMP